MSQASNWGVPAVGPATPTVMATRMNDSFNALLSQNKGATRPSYAAAGTSWLDDSGTLWVLYLFDGSSDIEIAKINPTSHEVLLSASFAGDVRAFGAVGDGVADDSAAFLAMLATPGWKIVPAGTYLISGSFPLLSGTTLIFVGNPTINITLDDSVFGFHVEDGSENVHIRGEATINYTVNSNGADGSYNNVFTFNSTTDYSTDPTGVRNCSLKGRFKINGEGPNNGKAVGIYGYAEYIEIEGVYATGTTNIAMTAHWRGNQPDSSTAPTKTWHPHEIYWRNCGSDNAGANLNCLVISGCGKVVVDDLWSDGVDETLYLFCGDYGYSFAQNIDEDADAFQIFVNRMRVTNPGSGFCFSVDSASSGVNSSPRWIGSDHNATVVVNGLSCAVPADEDSFSCFAITSLRYFEISALNYRELGDGNTEAAVELFGIHRAKMSGSVVCRSGTRVRDCGVVEWGLDVIAPFPDPSRATRGINCSGTSAATTVAAAATAGDETITIDGTASLGTYAGGYLVYNDGSTDHEIEILSAVHAATGEQTIAVSPLPVNISEDDSITIVQTVKRLVVGPVKLHGFQANARFTGTTTARVRNVLFDGTLFSWGGGSDVDATAVDGITFRGTVHKNGGQLTSSTNRYGVIIGSAARNFLFDGAHWDGTNTRIRASISISDSAVEGRIVNCHFGSYNSAATTPAAVLLNRASNVLLDPVSNTLGSGVPLVSPTTGGMQMLLTIASGAVTLADKQRKVVALDTEAAAASDDLDTINGAAYIGQVIILRTASSSRDVTVKDGTGNILLPSDRTLSATTDSLTLEWNGSNWVELGYADNTA